MLKEDYISKRKLKSTSQIDELQLMPYYTKFRARVLHVSFCTYKNKFVPSKCAILVCVHLAFCIFYFYITLALLRIFFFKAEKQDNIDFFFFFYSKQIKLNNCVNCLRNICIYFRKKILRVKCSIRGLLYGVCTTSCFNKQTPAS